MYWGIMRVGTLIVEFPWFKLLWWGVIVESNVIILCGELLL